jgi:hypothetical protein
LQLLCEFVARFARASVAGGRRGHLPKPDRHPQNGCTRPRWLLYFDAARQTARDRPDGPELRLQAAWHSSMNKRRLAPFLVDDIIDIIAKSAFSSPQTRPVRRDWAFCSGAYT